MELADRQRFINYCWKGLMFWHNWAHKEAHDKRMELVVLENQLQFDKMMRATEEDAIALAEAEQAVKKRKDDIIEQVNISFSIQFLLMFSNIG